MSRWLRFEERDALPGRKTRWWGVIAQDGDVVLGQIMWYGPWRKYCFFPHPARLVFEQTCLRDIAAFIEEQTRAHRSRAATLAPVGSGGPEAAP